MSQKNHDEESRLGHDPLEWLEDDELEKQDNSSTVVNEQPTPAHENSEEDEMQQNISAPEDSLPSDQQDTVAINKFKQNGRTGKLFLPERLMVQSIESLHKEWLLLAEIDNLNQLNINAGQVEDIDAAGLQLLFVLIRQLTSNGCQVVLDDVPDKLDNAFVQAGLADYFKAFVHAA
ncbi:anti-sigma factor antagonist [Paraneptunicella aestuarii]|uniref:STAS domain-containing protein n=1 Tax=Paraneptunicella aestuarii TaxID=2831148 RepID=UPI001E494051|nr:STAS domain-containing protein [Paraneptunicella aestuarii]UAA38749.1 anti-sigma factor antagonist [Paraneptunicella aestuarii]